MNVPEFFPKPGDEKKVEYYESGELRDVLYLRGARPANGWSRTQLYKDGSVKMHQCYSNSLLIEQISYDEQANIVSHKIYSHAVKGLVDKPVVKPLPKPNVVSGYGHMGFYFEHLPRIASFIEAEYSESELFAAYNAFLEDIDNVDYYSEEWLKKEKEYSWGMVGKAMRFRIWFEPGEMLYQWSLTAGNEDDYWKAREFMEKL